MTTLASPTTRTSCRVCRQPLETVLDLGSQYPSDFPNSAGGRPPAAVPLVLTRCTNPDCGLVQLQHTTPRDWLYRHYWYRSGVNETMVAELDDIVRSAVQRVVLPPHSIVMDIGANDGTLLSRYPQHGFGGRGSAVPIIRVAYEPARNLYDAVRPHADVLFPGYFEVESRPGSASAAKAQARVLTSIAMFYDLDDPHAFVAAARLALHPEGLWVIQQAYLPFMLANTDFTNICHEHLEYYSLHSLEYLLAAHNLEVVDVALRDINGGSFRTYVRHRGVQEPTPAVAELRAAERHRITTGCLHGFAATVATVQQELRAVLSHFDGRPVDLYAASTKANTLLQTCGLDARQIRQAWERSPEKIGRYVGTSGIPIISEEEGRKDPPAALLVVAWAFREAFLQREAAYLQAGGAIIFPLPTVEVIGQTQRLTVARGVPGDVPADATVPGSPAEEA